MLTPHASDDGCDDGFTLIELIVSIGLLGVIFSTLSLVMLGAMNANDETRERLDATRDEQFVAAYFATDVAGATQVLPSGASQCGTGTAVVTLVGTSFVPSASATATPSSTTTVAAYVFDATTGTLTRRYCEGSGMAPFTTPVVSNGLASRLTPTAPVVTCFTGATATACSGATTKVSVAFSRAEGGQFTLYGTRRATP